MNVDKFEIHRDRLFGLSYRMTGSVADAEDICQEAWLRWQRLDPAEVANVEAYLVRVATNLALDRLKSATSRREKYVGVWLPEPLRTPPATGVTDPAHHVELADTLTLSFLILLDELSDLERAAFLLHDVFGYNHHEVANIIDRSEAATRQLVSRARAKVRRPDADPGPTASERELATISKVLECVLTGDVAGAMALMSPNIVHLSDGGGLRRAAVRPVVGARAVAKFFSAVAQQAHSELAMEVASVNERPSLIVSIAGEIESVMSFEFDDDGLLVRIYSHRNPNKLRHLQPS